MLMKSAFIYALSLTLGIAAVTHAKTLMIEQFPQEADAKPELAYRTGQPSLDGFSRVRRHRMRPKLSYLSEHWWASWIV